MASGIIKRVHLQGGYGFIKQSDGIGADCFFHMKDLSPNLDFDESLTELEVLFDVIAAERGPRAKNVRMAP